MKKNNQKELIIVCNCKELALRVREVLRKIQKRILKGFKQISSTTFRVITFESTQIELSTILTNISNRNIERIKFELTE